MITALGIAWPFVLNAVSFLAVILALWMWRREAGPASALPAERFLAAIRAGLRYARGSRSASGSGWRAGRRCLAHSTDRLG